MKPAVFLDRDGVINELVLNTSTGEYEPPHSTDDLVLRPYVIQSLSDLQNACFVFFLVSNQPDYAKGKTTLEQIQAVHERLDHLLKSEGILFRDYYYCYHHPNGIIPKYSTVCECRKPKPYFLLKAAREYRIDLAQSWMIGDRDTDIECGKAAGTWTILIENSYSSGYRGLSKPDFTAANLKDAVRIILRT
ncbi:D-glycero-alpha-D-manno-heptose-1,7-bisphosphate 7-phosphatase [Methanoregula sp.]|uniref:D-glycero-alpha-D-manno-heptose-1,7-bisphosphate 7-phosphatase n=1 Tax=Methanoregula sp. TaxID=2052170 RepID=UPI003563E76E